MKGKILFVVGLGVGYVLGTRAGRERYEQIRKAAEGVWNTPVVQQGVDTVKGFAAEKVGDLSDTVLDGVKSLIGNATRGTGATRNDVSSAAKTAKQNVSKTAAAAKSAVDSAASALDDAIDDAAELASSAASGAKTTATSTAKRAPTKRSTTGKAKPAASDS
ncbi:type IV secretory pathway TrbL component [Agromyces hippuratus]|uniref:Type IV secretory pathway TrbL component n=1 Tax=Agromyces hippuratus TaxID=286438 RepID=A0A852X7C9_9MICO|nr:YtxH domain-containing protein [Agromyces hippuratus]NYG21871.1 type IV secretory pathway TrbL component [Agromyces hippuratus]